ncbi:hypothetical protein [Nocardia sp. NPDC019302]|uniref:hypothetical protein n=1 Tax=Nocardia sp. NPDC019302 TaxID=3154592 RepID=UPI0033D9BC53
MRKKLAGWFIRTGQRIYRPTVEELAAEVKQIIFADGSVCRLNSGIEVRHSGMTAAEAAAAVERASNRRTLAHQRFLR